MFEDSGGTESPSESMSHVSGNPVIEEKEMHKSSFVAEPPLAGQATSTVEAMALRLKLAAAVGLILAAALTAPPVRADDPSPAGLWKNVHDVSGKPRALIRITESNGTLQGKIEQVFPGPTEDPNPKCDKCEGANKNAPVMSLVILSGLTKEQDDESKKRATPRHGVPVRVPSPGQRRARDADAAGAG